MELEAEPVSRASTRIDWSEPLYPGVIVRYRVPGVGHPDRPVFDAIAALLRGRHGMLGVKLLDDQGPAISLIVDHQLIHTYRLGSPGGFNIIVRARRDEDLAAIEAAVETVLGELERGRVDRQALERARKAMRLEWVQIQSSRSRLAYELGTFQVMDSWKTLLPFMEARQRVSTEDIQRIAREYFVPANRTVALSRARPSVGSQSQ
jgi:predicted Zn-dependent peptidase